jgi:hypothetical protein
MFRDAYSTRQTTLEESIHEAVVHRMAEVEQLLAEEDRRLEEANLCLAREGGPGRC